MTEQWMLMAAFGATLVTIIAVVVLWRGMEVARTSLEADKNVEYKKIAEASLAAQETLAAEQKSVRAVLEDIRARLTAVEKLLREVG
jgi:hypothetical protein